MSSTVSRAVLLGALALLGAGCVLRPAEPGAHAWPLGWIDEDGDCQDTETEVLIREAAGLITWADPEGCTLHTGHWKSWAYDAEVPVRHLIVVPLVTPRNAERSGAADWSRRQKLRFLNDQENLIVLDVPQMQVRGDHGPDRWVPHENYWCRYARRWESVKQRYGLVIPDEERGALEHMKRTRCLPAGARPGLPGLRGGPGAGDPAGKDSVHIPPSPSPAPPTASG